MFHPSLRCVALPLITSLCQLPGRKQWVPTTHLRVSLSDVVGTLNILDRSPTWSVSAVSYDRKRGVWAIELKAGTWRYRYELRSFKALTYLMARSVKLTAYATQVPLGPRLALA